MAVKIVETHSLSPPPPPSGADQSLPLVYFDMIWLDFILTETLHFYPLKCSQSHFLNTILIHLKNSLSLALQHFYPLSSNIIFPLTPSAMPSTAPAALPLTVAISDADFAILISNSPKPSAEFHQFVPQLPPPLLHSSADIRFSPVAIQLTFFPNEGFCIGLTVHHAICDASTLSRFLRTWAAFNRGEDSDSDSIKNLLPSYSRDSIQDSNRLTVFRWNQIKKSKPTVSQTLPPPNFHKLLRATFKISDSQIKKLKSFAMIKNPSTFVAVCAHIWTTMARTDAAAEDANDEPYYLGSPVDCRRRLIPPLPDSYFGNCVMPLIAVSTRETLRGNGGFAAAVAAVVAAIEVVGKSTRVSEFFYNRSEIMSELVGKKAVWIVGSLRIDHYGADADFGWGEAVKYECIHTDYQGVVHLCKGREGGVEFGLSMEKDKMGIFADVFHKNLIFNSNL
ncbi:anthocyanidin 3-O-glucoside 6''-O-acyltransferase-like [Salvia hispanica]|uniref:anthocyanidin 3-O-glucoside 6''-O-acyltransferase-like n=1 Tax=Salvia hispanica TaxID=49212 RepID=UPI00200947B1|nr:anthocyanidin 3-O-glucoside 6''-O-acyltransferase-like [Salvia hispanica]